MIVHPKNKDSMNKLRSISSKICKCSINAPVPYYECHAYLKTCACFLCTIAISLGYFQGILYEKIILLQQSGYS